MGHKCACVELHGVLDVIFRRSRKNANTTYFRLAARLAGNKAYRRSSSELRVFLRIFYGVRERNSTEFASVILRSCSTESVLRSCNFYGVRERNSTDFDLEFYGVRSHNSTEFAHRILRSFVGNPISRFLILRTFLRSWTINQILTSVEYCNYFHVI